MLHLYDHDECGDAFLCCRSTNPPHFSKFHSQGFEQLLYIVCSLASVLRTISVCHVTISHNH